MAMARDEWLALWSIPPDMADDAWSEKQDFDARHVQTAMVMSDHIDPILSHADGKMYDSKSALYRSYKPEGNPQGVRYECVGEKVVKPFERPKRDKEKAMQAVKRTLDQMGI